jgi:hypothetical protein
MEGNPGENEIHNPEIGTKAPISRSAHHKMDALQSFPFLQEVLLFLALAGLLIPLL